MRTRYTPSQDSNPVFHALSSISSYLARNKLITAILSIILIWIVILTNYVQRNQQQQPQTPINNPLLTSNTNNNNKQDLIGISDKITNHVPPRLPKTQPNDQNTDDTNSQSSQSSQNSQNSVKTQQNTDDDIIDINDSSNSIDILDQNTDKNNNDPNNPQQSIESKLSNNKKIVITYGQNCCASAKKRMCDTAFDAGKADECYAYDASVMDADFSTKNAHILKQGRGAGYWLWKPYIIYKHLTDPNLPDGSYIIYSDAGAKLVGDVKHVLRFMEEEDDRYKGVLFFGVGFDQRNFCKRDAFILQDCDREECYNAMQINAFVAFFRKCEYSRMVVKTWLDECQDERILTDIPNTQGEGNLRGFRDHRHDQAVITNVMNAHGWKYDTTNGPVLDKVFYHDRFKG